VKEVRQAGSTSLLFDTRASIPGRRTERAEQSIVDPRNLARRRIGTAEYTTPIITETQNARGLSTTTTLSAGEGEYYNQP
jgi:hypothetical protein